MTLNPQENWYLRKADIKSTLTSEELAQLYASSSRKGLAKGDIMWLDDDSETYKVYVVDEGYAGLCKTSDDGRRFILDILGPGDFFGALSPGQAPSSLEEYLEVVRDIKLIALEADVFHKTLAHYPHFTLRLVKIVENRKRALEQRITSILFKDVTARTAEFLLDICTKYADDCPLEPGNRRDLTLTHQEIADIVGATRPVISAIISQMTKAGLLEKHQRVLCVRNTVGIRQIAEQGSSALTALGASTG